MEQFKIFVDGKEIPAVEGQTVLEASLAAGHYIPHLCSHPDLESQGGCKLCVIQVDGAEQPVTACTTIVREEMQVITKSPVLDKIRRYSMQLMLAGHPGDCTGCRSYGNCELQAMMQYLSSVANPGMRRVVHKSNTINTVNPLIDREMERCIRCGRCIRVCNDVRGVGILQYNKLNGEVYVGTVEDLPLNSADCRFCGACVEVCPTGALQDREGVFRKDLRREEALIPCSADCPAHTDVPTYLRLINEGKYADADAVIRQKLPIPHSLGFVCTAYCQKACKRKGLNGSIAIRDLKRFAVEHDPDKAWMKRAVRLPATGKKVAVVGGGPCGLTAAYYLSKKGHDVTVYERYPTCGGMLAYGIPAYRIPREVVAEEVDIIGQFGVKFVTNHPVSDVRELSSANDAVLVAVGASDGKIIPTANMVAEQCTTAIDVLRDIAMGKETTPKIGKDTKVLVFGGGNVAFDAARSCARLGAKVSVVCLEARNQMTSDDEEIEQAKEEGIAVYPGQTNTGFVTENGAITGLNIIGVSDFKFTPTGLQVTTVPGTEQVVPCEVVIYASGQKTNLTADFGLELNRPGYPVDPATGKSGFNTSIPNVYTAGDVITGTKSVIHAVAAGRDAAERIDKLLGGDGNIEEVLADVEPANPNIGKIEGFGNLPRYTQNILPVEQRCDNFNRIDGGLTEQQAHEETTRCLKCPLRCTISGTKVWTEYMN